MVHTPLSPIFFPAPAARVMLNFPSEALTFIEKPEFFFPCSGCCPELSILPAVAGVNVSFCPPETSGALSGVCDGCPSSDEHAESISAKTSIRHNNDFFIFTPLNKHVIIYMSANLVRNQQYHFQTHYANHFFDQLLFLSSVKIVTSPKNKRKERYKRSFRKNNPYIGQIYLRRNSSSGRGLS